MDPHITFIGLGVSDLARAIQFYEQGLGLPRLESPDTIAFFAMGATMLSLYPRDKLAEDITVSPEGSGFPGFTLAHNVGSPEDVDATLAEAVAAGATLIKPGQKGFLGRLFGIFHRSGWILLGNCVEPLSLGGGHAWARTASGSAVAGRPCLAPPGRQSLYRSRQPLPQA